MDARATRIGVNEGVFREVNERLRDIGESFSLVAEQAEFVCECGDASCIEQIRMPLTEYERVRAEPTWFAIRPGHDKPDVETVVERQDGYHIVAKHAGDPAALARDQARGR